MADGGRSGMVRGRVVDVDVVDETPASMRDVEAERAVLAAVLLDEGQEGRVWQRVSAILGAEDFYSPEHRVFWQAFCRMHVRRTPLDVHTVVAELRAMDKLHTVGGVQAVGGLTDWIPTVAHCESHAGIVAAAARRRRIAAIGTHLARAAEDPTRDLAQLRDSAVGVLRGVRMGVVKVPDAADLVAEMWQGIDDRMSGKTAGPLPFGVPTLDRMSDGGTGVGGMKRGGTYFLSARPGIGKTTLACQITAAAASSGERVLYVALEPKRVEITQSVTACHARVGIVKMTRAPHQLTPSDMHSLTMSSRDIATWPLHVIDETADDCPNTVALIEAAMCSLPEMPSLVVIDHILKMRPVGRYAKKHEGVEEIVAGLVSLGKRTGASILALCHIGRAIRSGALNRKPTPEDIQGGDVMARDADGLLILHREDKYPTDRKNVDNPNVRGIVEVFAPKLRGVEDDTAGRMRFHGDVQRFDAIVSGHGPNDSRDVTADAPDFPSYGDAE